MEEQFYLPWPLLLVFLAQLRTAGGQTSTRLVATVLTAVAVASFVASYHFTLSDEPCAFFFLRPGLGSS